MNLSACNTFKSTKAQEVIAGDIKITNGDTTTVDSRINLSLNSPKASFMQISNTPDCSGGVLEPYATSKFWDLPLVSGTAVVSVLFKDNADGASLCSTTSIRLILAPPISSSFVLFQPDAISNSPNAGGAVSDNAVGTNWGSGTLVDTLDSNQLKFYQNDRVNRRMLIFNTPPSSAASRPDVVIGQADFNSAGDNSALHGPGVNEYGFAEPMHATVCENGKFYITDRGNNRVLGYSRIPTANDTPAAFVLGQVNFTANSAGAGASQMTTPYALTCKRNVLYVADRGNNRVLVFNPAPSTTAAAASLVIGQTGFGLNATSCSATGLNNPIGITSTQTGQILISDRVNNRVLVYNDVPTTNGQAFDHVIGQADFTSCSVNEGAGLTAQSLSGPTGINAFGDVLSLTDYGNARLFFYRLPITSDHPTAFSKLGVADFTSSGTQSPVSQNSIFRPYGVSQVPGGLLISDTDNNRLVGVPAPW